MDEYSNCKLIKLYDCNNKCDEPAFNELRLVRDGILNIDIDLFDDDFV